MTHKTSAVNGSLARNFWKEIWRQLWWSGSCYSFHIRLCYCLWFDLVALYFLRLADFYLLLQRNMFYLNRECHKLFSPLGHVTDTLSPCHTVLWLPPYLIRSQPCPFLYIIHLLSCWPYSWSFSPQLFLARWCLENLSFVLDQQQQNQSIHNRINCVQYIEQLLVYSQSYTTLKELPSLTK